MQYLLYLIMTYQIHDEEVAENNSRTQHGRQQDIALPLLSAEAFVNPWWKKLCNYTLCSIFSIKFATL